MQRRLLLVSMFLNQMLPKHLITDLCWSENCAVE